MAESKIKSDLSKTITWQFDKSVNLINFIAMLAEFGGSSTEELYDSISGKMNLTYDDGCTEFTLALIGRMLDTKWPDIKWGDGDVRPMTKTLYRRLLLGKWRLFSSMGTPKDYFEYFHIVFDDTVRMTNDAVSWRTSSLNTEPIDIADPTDLQVEMRLAYEQHMRLMIPTLSGVGLTALDDDVISTEPSICFKEQADNIEAAHSVEFIDVEIIGARDTVIPKDSVITPDDDNQEYQFLSYEEVMIGSDGKATARFYYTGYETYKGYDLETVVDLKIWNPDITEYISGVNYVIVLNRVVPEQTAGNLGVTKDQTRSPFYWGVAFMEPIFATVIPPDPPTPPGPDPEEFTGTEITVDIRDGIADRKIKLQRVEVALGKTLQIDWGDGTVDANIEHEYSSDGEYTIKISDTITTLMFSDDGVDGPQKDVNITCSRLGDNLIDIAYCFYKCKLSGSIPTMGQNVKYANFAFALTSCEGEIPPWPDNVIDADGTYAATNTTGKIPQWGKNITTANQTYYHCTLLSGIWDESASAADIMPSHITSHNSCVADASSAVRKHFTSAWGGTKQS